MGRQALVDYFYRTKEKTFREILLEMHARGDTILLGFGGVEIRGFITAFGEDFVYFQKVKSASTVMLTGGKPGDLVGRVKHVPLRAITSVAHVQED